MPADPGATSPCPRNRASASPALPPWIPHIAASSARLTSAKPPAFHIPTGTVDSSTECREPFRLHRNVSARPGADCVESPRCGPSIGSVNPPPSFSSRQAVKMDGSNQVRQVEPAAVRTTFWMGCRCLRCALRVLSSIDLSGILVFTPARLSRQQSTTTRTSSD